MKDAQEATKILQRTFKGGPMRRIPKKREDADVLLSLSLVGLDPEGIFDEQDINLHLSSWLAEISADTGSADYVTWRRQLVDFGYLRRASDGQIYRIRGEYIDAVLSEPAKRVDAAQVFAAVSTERANRRRSFQR